MPNLFSKFKQNNIVYEVVDAEARKNVVPKGLIVPFGGTTAPTGWLLCDGSAVSRDTYSELFAVIGTNYGAGDGTTTFNLPDMREATAKGAGTSGKSVGAHNAISVGSFIDDRVEEHVHQVVGSNNESVVGAAGQGSLGYTTGGYAYTFIGLKSATQSGRKGTTTEVKAVGVNYIIKY